MVVEELEARSTSDFLLEPLGTFFGFKAEQTLRFTPIGNCTKENLKFEVQKVCLATFSMTSLPHVAFDLYLLI